MTSSRVSTGKVEDQWANACATALRDRLLSGGFNEIAAPRRDVALDWRPSVNVVAWEGVVLQRPTPTAVDLVVLFRTWINRPDCLFGWRDPMWKDEASRRQLVDTFPRPEDLANELHFEIVEGLEGGIGILPERIPTRRIRGLPSESNPTSIIWVHER